MTDYALTPSLARISFLGAGVQVTEPSCGVELALGFFRARFQNSASMASNVEALARSEDAPGSTDA
jgi:hypothetical protein